MNANNKNYSIRPLTAEEREFSADESNYNQLFSYMKKRRLDPETWYDILIVPYLNAVKKYHEYEHLQKYGFHSILKRILDTAVNHHFRGENAEKRMPEGGICSLDYTMQGDNPFSEHPVEAYLIDHKANTEKQVMFEEAFHEFYQKCITIVDEWNGETFVSEYLKHELDLLLEGCHTIKQVNRKTEKQYPYGYNVDDLKRDMEKFRQIFMEIFGI